MRIVGNGLRHCVRLGILVEIESEFAGNEYRMKTLWTNEVWWQRKKMHWRTWEVRQYIFTLAHLPSAPRPRLEPAQLSGSG